MSISIPLQLLAKCQLTIHQTANGERLGLDMSPSAYSHLAADLDGLTLNFDSVSDHFGRGIQVSLSYTQPDVPFPNSLDNGTTGIIPSFLSPTPSACSLESLTLDGFSQLRAPSVWLDDLAASFLTGPPVTPPSYLPSPDSDHLTARNTGDTCSDANAGLQFSPTITPFLDMTSSCEGLDIGARMPDSVGCIPQSGSDSSIRSPRTIDAAALQTEGPGYATPSPVPSFASHPEFIQELPPIVCTDITEDGEFVGGGRSADTSAHSHSTISSSERCGKRRTRRYRCLNAGCDRRFISEYTRKVHMDGVHNPKPRKMLACSMGCGELFGRRHDRLRHEVAQHGKVCEFLCQDCEHFFSSARMLAIHKCRGRQPAQP